LDHMGGEVPSQKNREGSIKGKSTLRFRLCEKGGLGEGPRSNLGKGQTSSIKALEKGPLRDGGGGFFQADS